MSDESVGPKPGEPKKAETWANESAERQVRLASIVAIDVVGFSTMSEKDQRKTAEKIEALRHRIDATAKRHEGRIFNTAGDGFMLEFVSAGAALGAINDLLDNKPKKEPPIRVGAHVGDVVVTVNNDLLGHGVNVAARLQSLAPPNTALVSGEFRSMARTSPSAVFQSRGRQPLENIDQRVATFAIVSSRQRLMTMMRRTMTLLIVATVLGSAGYFGGPYALRWIDEQDFMAKIQAGDAAAEQKAETAPQPVAEVPATTVATTAAAPALEAGQTFKDCENCPQMIVVPGGAFQMGSPANERMRDATEGPQHEVNVKPFATGVYEVTFAEWDACLAGGGCNGFSPPDHGWGRGRRPVIGVSWSDAEAYVQWLNRTTGRDDYRLLTEAEWEYAARGGTTSRYAFGDNLTRSQATFGVQRTDPVGSYAANAFGLYDMHGNAAEWVSDCFVATYADAPTDGSAAAPAQCVQRVYRGGGYSDVPSALRSANRRRAIPSQKLVGLGFRVARGVE